MNEETQLVKDLHLGIDAEAFLQGPIGRYLQARVDAEIGDAMDAFKRADPSNAAQIRDIQHRIWRAEHFMEWLLEAIQNGRYAEAELRGLD